MTGTPVCTAYLAPINTTSWTDSKSIKFDLATPISAGSYTLYIEFEADNGKANVCDLDSFVFSDIGTVTYSNAVKIEGYQISTAVEGSRVVGSVEPTINGSKVETWGFIYGLASANGENYNVSDNDMMVGSNHEYVVSYESTAEGTSPAPMGASKTATYFVRTMTFGGKTAAAFNATYKVRAYAVLSDGTYVYSDVSDYSIYRIANALYQNKLMSSETGHKYLYNTILKTVDPNYIEVDFAWNNTIISPDSF